MIGRLGIQERVAERMEHLDRRDRQKGHGYWWEQGNEKNERLERNVGRVEEELRCKYEECGKICRSKAGLVMHEKRKHRESESCVELQGGER